MPYGAGNVPKSLVATEIEGKRYTGFYTVVSGIITVESDWGELREPTLAPKRKSPRVDYFFRFFRAHSLGASLTRTWVGLIRPGKPEWILDLATQLGELDH